MLLGESSGEGLEQYASQKGVRWWDYVSAVLGKNVGEMHAMTDMWVVLGRVHR